MREAGQFDLSAGCDADVSRPYVAVDSVLLMQLYQALQCLVQTVFAEFFRLGAL